MLDAPTNERWVAAKLRLAYNGITSAVGYRRSTFGTERSVSTRKMDESPPTAALNRYRYLLFTVVALALTGAVGYGLAHRPAPVIFEISPPDPTPLPTIRPTAGPLRCHVIGGVKAPGVYTLAPGALVDDAIQAAGGPTVDADLTGLNLADAVQDHQQISVPRRVPNYSLGTPSNTAGTGAGPVNINTADVETLQSLPGIGPVLADRIVSYRDANGPFFQVDDLVNVKGIGQTRLEQLRPLITIGP